MNEPFDLTIRDQLFQVHPSQNEPARAIVLALHGHTGDEHSMEIFTRKFHRDYCVIYPRAFYKLDSNSYSWVNSHANDLPDGDAWMNSANRLHVNLDALTVDLDLLGPPTHIIGFSQGAALGLVYSILFSSPTTKTAILAGFLPQGVNHIIKDLNQHLFYVYYAKNDKTIPPAEAVRLVNFLHSAGAAVEYCESTAGHKLSLECLHAMEAFILRDPSKNNQRP